MFRASRLLLAIFFATLPIHTAFAACNEYTAHVVARAFLFNNFLNLDEMSDLLNQNKVLFLPGGSALRCMQSLGIKLTQAGLNAYDPKALERAYRTGGPPEMAEQVARKINSGSANLNAMGQEFLWLAEVLPAAVQGNAQPYLSTKPLSRPMTHQQAYNVLMPMIIQTLGPQFKPLYLAEFEKQMPLPENQIALMAIMYGD